MKKILLFVFAAALTFSLHAQIITVSNPEIVPVELIKITPKLSDIPESPLPPPDAPRVERDNPSLENPMPQPTNPNPLPLGADPAWQSISSVTRGNEPVIDVLSVWAGLTANVDPSDNTIAVGPNEVVQMTNAANSSYVRIWDKSGNVIAANKVLSDLTGFGDFGDCNIVYDPIADRFAICALSDGFNTKLIVCVSQTPDPNGAYYAYKVTMTGGFPDYPKISVWGNSYFITTNSNQPSITAFNRDSMLAGATLSAGQHFSLTSFPAIGFQAPSPVTFTGTTQPDAGTPMYTMRVADDAWGSSIDSDHLEIYEVSIDWANTSNSSISGPFNLTTIPYNSSLCGFSTLSCIKQPGTNTKLDPLSNILMDKLQYRRLPGYEVIVCSHVCNANGNGLAGVRWYELRKLPGGNWFIHQQGTYAIDADSRWMSSITINEDGKIALGYNISSTTVYPGIRVTGRNDCDSLGLMTAAETSIQEGSNHNGSNRYGDYNAVVTDPVDGSFWITGNYNQTTSWDTRVAHFTLSDCVLTGVAEQNNAQAFSVLPIPSSGNLQVSFYHDCSEDVTMQLIDDAGKTVSQQVLHVTAGATSTMIDVSALANGIYVLKLQSCHKTSVHKVVVSR